MYREFIRGCGLLAGILLTVTRCDAQILTFVPGDAYFRSELTEERIKCLEAGSEFAWTYRMPDWLEPEIPKLRTFAGVPTLKTVDIPKSTSNSLVALYRSLRNTHPKQIEEVTQDGKVRESREINGFPIFMYSSSYNASKFGLGLRYNEAWPQITELARKRQRLTPQEFYQPISKNHELIIKEWQWAHKVDGFPCQPLPDEDWQETFDPLMPYKFPVIAKGVDLQFIVCESRNVEATMNDKPYHAFNCVFQDKVIRHATVSNADLGGVGYRKVQSEWHPEKE